MPPALLSISPDEDIQRIIPNVKKVGVIYSDVKEEYFATKNQYITEKDAYKDAKHIASEITKLGITTIMFPGDENLVNVLKREKFDMVFNLVDSIKGNEYLSSTIPGILDMAGVPYTGAGMLGLALCYNKFLTKVMLRSCGLPVPNFQLFTTPNDQLDINLRFPLFSKLNEIHGAVEINDSAVSENENALRERLAFLINTYKQQVLVEEYISGREVTAMILKGSNTKVYMGEKIFNRKDKKYVFATFDDQWSKDEINTLNVDNWSYNYQKYEDEYLKETVKRAYEITRMEDYGKFDIRIDDSGRYFFIDVNLNPAFGPYELGTSMGNIIQKIHGISFLDILKRLIVNAVTY